VARRRGRAGWRRGGAAPRGEPAPARAPPPAARPAPRTSIRPAPPASPVAGRDRREAEQRGRSAERGSERMLCAPCAAQSRVSGVGASAPRALRRTRARWGGAGCRMRRGPATRPPRSFGGHLFRPWTFQLYVGVEGGGCTGAGDRRAPDSDAAHMTAPRLQQLLFLVVDALSLPHINFVPTKQLA
jgi:hypothetical protein